MEINNKKFSKKDLTIIILVVLGILLCIFGLMDKIFEHTIFNFFKKVLTSSKNIFIVKISIIILVIL